MAFNPYIDGYGYNGWSKFGVYDLRLVHFLSIFVISLMGKYMKDRINKHRERLSNFYARHGSNNLTPEHASRAVNMLVKWKWRLTAGDSFEVNNGIIPLVIGTVMSYFLFIFQLRAAENYSSHQS